MSGRTAATGARSAAVGLRSWLVVLVALLLSTAGAGGAALMLTDVHHAEQQRLAQLVSASTDLVLAASDTGAAGGPQVQDDRLAAAADAATELASTPQERTAVAEQVAAARARVAAVRAGGPPPPAPAPGAAPGAAPSAADGLDGTPGDLLLLHRRVVDLAEQQTAVVRDQERSLRDASLAVVGLVLVGALALTVLLASRVRRGLVEPLADVATVLGALAAGDHTSRASTDRGPAEVRALAGSVNALADEGDRSRRVQDDTARLRRLATEVGRLARDPVDPSASLEEALRVLGEGLGVDRAWVRLLDDARPGAGRSAASTFAAVQGAWARAGAPPVVEEVGSDQEEVASWLQRTWEAGGHYVAADLRALVAAGGATGPAVDLLERTGASAVVVTPVGAGDAAVGALTVLCADERRDWTEEELALLRSVASDLGRAVVVSRLLQDSEQLVDRLRELDVRKSTFLATVSHELRTPLTSIAGYVEMLREGGAGPVSDGVDRMLGVVERNTVRLRVLIEDLLALSRIEDGAPRGVPEPVALGEVLRAVADEHRAAATEGGLKLDVDVDLDAELLGALRVMGDATSLRRAVTGLVSNAVKFTGSGGSVSLRAAQEDGWAVVEVSDTGIGIPAEEQGGLFTRFFRASNATSLAVPGAGLGLAITRSLVEHHDGRVVITSAVGEGTTARVLLPLPVPAPRPAAEV